MTRESCFGLEFDELRIQADCGLPSHGQWLREFLEPDFRASAGVGHCSVSVVADDAMYATALGPGPDGDAALLDCFALDSSVVRLPILRRSGTATTVFDSQFEAVYSIEPDDNHVRIVTRPGNARVRASLLRVVREFAMNYLLGRGLFLHASAVAVGDDGIATAGRKAAGKTTILTYLLSQGVGEYVSNDRVFVGDGGEAPVLRNIPTVISVRPGTLDFCEGFRRRFLDSGFSTYLVTLDESAEAETSEIQPNQFGNYFLSPAQYRSLLNARQRTCVAASALLLPVIRDDEKSFSLRELQPEEALARVPEALLGSGSWRKGKDALAIPGSAPAAGEHEVAQRAEAFCLKVRCFEVRLGARAYRNGDLAREIAQLAGR